MKPKVLFYDIEVSPMRFWGYPGRKRGEAIALETISDQFVMSISYKWAGQKKVHFISLPDYESYKSNPECDKSLCEAFWEVLDQADVVIGHYSRNFDTPKMMTRFLYHGLGRPSFFEEGDTKRMAAKLGFPSNSLNEVARYLGIGRKVGSHGDLWLDCLNGDSKAWKAMRDYNNQDVLLTEAIYDAMKPYVDNYPSMAKYYTANVKHDMVCEGCGSNHMQSRGIYATKTGFRKRYQCQECLAWFNGRNLFKSRELASSAPKGM